MTADVKETFSKCRIQDLMKMTQDGEGSMATTVETKMEASPVKAAAAAAPEQSESSSSASPEKEQDKLSKAQNALVQGKRHFLMKDTAHACSALGDACNLLTEIYGPIASEHAEAHFFYGKTLLDLARAELSVFEAPAAGEKSEDDDDEDTEGDDEDGEQEKNGDEENGEESEESAEKEEKSEEEAEPKLNTEGEVTVSEEDLNAPSPAPGPSTADANDGEQPSTSSGVKAEGADPDDLSNLELAWEVLEIAKLGFKKQIEEVEAKLKEKDLKDRDEQECTLKQMKRRLAETHTVLGEVSTESENYPQAVEDFKLALAMVSELESPDSREIAQIHFHIGVAHGLAKEFQDSVASFNKSVEIIRQRVANLKKSLEIEENDAAKKEQLDKEIKELSELLPELEERINDTLEQEKEASKVEEEEKMEEEIIQRNSPVKNPNPPAANDISHLVKKRKKVEEPAAVPAESEPPSKKACTNNLNFDAPVNGHSKETKKEEVTSAPAPATAE